jgi:hypothetical protein
VHQHHKTGKHISTEACEIPHAYKNTSQQSLQQLPVTLPLNNLLTIRVTQGC